MSGRSILERRVTLTAAALLGALASVVALPAAADAAPSYRIIDLNVGDNSSANAVNEQGHVVGDREGRPFLWRNGQATLLLPDGEFGRAEDANNRDEVVGNRFVNGASHGFLWRRGVVTDLGVLPGGDNSFASAINDHGEIVGWSATAPNNGDLHAFRWRDGTMTDLGVPPEPFSQSIARDINNAGQIAGDMNRGGMDLFAVRWDRGGAVRTLSTQSMGMAINDLGDVTGLTLSGGALAHGYVWHRSALTEIPTPQIGFMPFLQPYGINNRVQVVGDTNLGAFLWQRGQLTTLPSLTHGGTAYDINNRGVIVGTSASQEGMAPHYHAVMWLRT